MFAPLVCRKCSKRRVERREIITEIVETEEKYGRDLRIILDEFYKPMRVAGLLTADQLSSVFLNAEELLEHNTMLAEKLRDGYEIAIEQGDEDLLTFNVGQIFLDATPMLHAFESYCTRQVYKPYPISISIFISISIPTSYFLHPTSYSCAATVPRPKIVPIP